MADVLKSRCTWPETFILVGHLLAVARSKDPARAVGAVVTNADNRIMATGYNGLKPGQPDNTTFWTGPDRQGCIHAEENALDYLERHVAPVNRQNLSMHVSHVPCEPCAKKIAKSGGFEAVYYPKFVSLNYRRRGDKYKEIEATRRILAKAGIRLEAVDVGLKTLAEISTSMTSLWFAYASKGVEFDHAMEDLTIGAQPCVEDMHERNKDD